MPNAVLISDRWAAQLKLASNGNQLCLAHLLRDVRSLAAAEIEEFAEQFKELLVKVFDLRREMSKKNEVCAKANPEELEKELNKLLAIPLVYGWCDLLRI